MVMRPVGPLSPWVYWRRRLVLIIVLVVIIILLVHACGGSSPSTNASHSGTPTTTPTSSASQSTIPTAPCNTKRLTVKLAAKTPNTVVGAEQTFIATVSYDSPDGFPCQLLLPPSQQVLTVSSEAGTQIYTDAGCQPVGATVQHTVEPGQRFRVKVKWDGKSSASGCTAGPAPAAGSYTARLTLGKATSTPATFTLSAG